MNKKVGGCTFGCQNDKTLPEGHPYTKTCQPLVSTNKQTFIMNLKVLILPLLLSLTSCGYQDAQKLQNEKIEKLEKKIEEIEAKVNFQELIANADTVAFLKPSVMGYAVIKFDLGYLTVQIVDATQFANSTKVKIKFGNPLGSTIKGVKGDFEWGSVNEKGWVKDELGSKEIRLTESLNSGSWTTATIVLEGLDVKNFGFLRIKNLSHTGILLSTR